MQKLKLNETPVRTSRNFNMNNIKLENIEIPEKIWDFEKVQIAMIVRGFAYLISKELPVEYAMEMNNLINLELEGAIG